MRIEGGTKTRKRTNLGLLQVLELVNLVEIALGKNLSNGSLVTFNFNLGIITPPFF